MDLDLDRGSDHTSLTLPGPLLNGVVRRKLINHIITIKPPLKIIKSVIHEGRAVAVRIFNAKEIADWDLFGATN